MKYPDWVYEKLNAAVEENRAAADEVRLIIDRLTELSEKARREGLLALEDDLDSLTDPLLKLGLFLVVDGTDPVIISAALVNCLTVGNPAEVLKEVVTIDGVLAIQEGVNPRTMKALLGSYLGAEAALAGYREG